MAKTKKAPQVEEEEIEEELELELEEEELDEVDDDDEVDTEDLDDDDEEDEDDDDEEDLDDDDEEDEDDDDEEDLNDEEDEEVEEEEEKKPAGKRGRPAKKKEEKPSKKKPEVEDDDSFVSFSEVMEDIKTLAEENEKKREEFSDKKSKMKKNETIADLVKKGVKLPPSLTLSLEVFRKLVKARIGEEGSKLNSVFTAFLKKAGVDADEAQELSRKVPLSFAGALYQEIGEILSEIFKLGEFSIPLCNIDGVKVALKAVHMAEKATDYSHLSIAGKSAGAQKVAAHVEVKTKNQVPPSLKKKGEMKNFKFVENKGSSKKEEKEVPAKKKKK